MSNLNTGKARIDILDALRGFALFGIILAHMNNQYYAGFPPPGHENMAVKNGLDAVLQTLSDIFITGKFYTIFSFLFGLSFGIQMLNAKEKGNGFAGRFAWRLVILFLIGFINQGFYRGDILSIYAVLGFFLLLFYKAGNKALLIWALFFILNMPGLIFKTVSYIQSFGKPASGQQQGMPEGLDFKKMQDDATVYYKNVKEGNVKEIIKTNITTGFSEKLAFQVFSGRLFVTMGLFILGLYMAKKKIFKNLHPYLHVIKKWILYCSIFCVSLIAIYLIFGEKLFMATGLLGLILSFLGEVFNPALTVVYVGGFILLFQKEGWRKRLSGLAPLGRMGLTTYITQTFVGVLLFYGYGLNLLDVIGNSVSFAIGIVIFLMQIFFSRIWMKYFNYGPFEWLWRSLTYLKIQPFKK